MSNVYIYIFFFLLIFLFLLLSKRDLIFALVEIYFHLVLICCGGEEQSRPNEWDTWMCEAERSDHDCAAGT